MSAKSDFKKAQQQIAMAKTDGATQLDLSDLPDLAELPDEIRTLTALTSLSLSDTQVTDIAPIAGLTALTSLYLSRTQITDIAPIAALTALTSLGLSGTQVTDIAPIARLTALTSLDLSDTKVTDITPIAGLMALRSLDLRSTQVTDITPVAGLMALTTLTLWSSGVTEIDAIAGLTALTRLDLWGTQVTDIAPLVGLTSLNWLDLRSSAAIDLRPLVVLDVLASAPRVFNDKDGRKILGGLAFTDCAAARADPRIAEIAEIPDPATRARTLFDYLENWVPPVPADSPLAPSFIVPDQGPITSAPDGLEGGDADQEELRRDLDRKASVLVEAIGTSNELAILRGAAEHYQTQVRKDLPAIRLNLLYSAANSLRVAYEADRAAIAQHRHSDQLPPKAAAALSDLVETHALFFMGFPNAAEVHRRMLEGLTGDRNRKLVEGAEPIVVALERLPKVLDPAVQAALADDLAGAKGNGPSAEIAEKRLAAGLGNLIGAVARKAYFASKAGTALILSHDIPVFILGQQTVIGKFLVAAQGAAAGWFDVLAQILMKL